MMNNQYWLYTLVNTSYIVISLIEQVKEVNDNMII